MQNIVEYLRECSVNRLFGANGFNNNWGTWAPRINLLTSRKTPTQILDIGDNLSSVFALTGGTGRTQGSLSAGGSSWESLICWYLNLCLVGRRTIVIKHNKSLIPKPISDAITVNYANFTSNTESDLIAITFPDREEYLIDKDEINILDDQGIKVDLKNPRTNSYNLLNVLNALSSRDFSGLEIHIIQCKTNWNDNAQIPMVWDMIYSARNFTTNVTIGKNGYSMRDVNRFTYSFVTVPTNNVNIYKATSTSVKRVINLTGGNYWGRVSVTGIASSVKEMLGRNLSNGHTSNILTTLNAELPNLLTTLNYFRL